MPRIIAGEFKSRRLLAPPDGEGSRPYLDRIKESVFAILRGWFDDANVLDLFAGVGTVGLEAVSRGAARVVMVEKDRAVARLLQQNINALGCTDRALVMQGDALSASVLAAAPSPVDLVFMDPPFAMMENELERARVLEQAARCRAVMADKSFLVLRSPFEPSEAVPLKIAGFAGPEVHVYSHHNVVLLYAPQPGDA